MSCADDIVDLWAGAVDKYESIVPKRKYKETILIQNLKTISDLETHLDAEGKALKDFRSKHIRLRDRLKQVLRPFMTLSDLISAALSASPLAPASHVLGAVFFVLKAADGVSEAYDWIEELFDKLRDFMIRLNEYVSKGLPIALRSKIVGILACLLEILACAELAVKDGRWKKFAAVFFLGGDERVKAAFDRLAALFQSEQSLVVVITYATNQNMEKQAVTAEKEDKERNERLNWISKLDFTKQQSDHLARKQPNTGDWFLKDSIFEGWVEESNKDWCLLCPGAPGAGKTTMAAAVIHHLSGLGSQDEIGVAYISCSYQSLASLALQNLVSSLLGRLGRVRSRIPQCLVDAHERLKNDRGLTTLECAELLGLVSNEFTAVYVIIDALDESPQVIRELVRIIRDLRDKANVGLLMTTRFGTHIEDMIKEELGALPSLEVRASDEDIGCYFESRQPNSQSS